MSYFFSKWSVVLTGVSAARWWRCWRKSRRGLNTRQWQPYLKSPLSLPTPSFPLTSLNTHATSSAASSWRPSTDQAQKSCSDIPSPRYCVEEYIKLPPRVKDSEEWGSLLRTQSMIRWVSKESTVPEHAVCLHPISCFQDEVTKVFPVTMSATAGGTTGCRCVATWISRNIQNDGIT